MRLVLADDDAPFREAVAELLCQRFEIQQCDDGKTTLREVVSNPPEALVLNLMMPGLDGLSLLNRLLDSEIYPAVLATTPLVTNYILDTATEINVSYLMLKPCLPEDVAQRVLHMTRKIRKPRLGPDSIRFHIAKMLQDIGLNPKHRGFAFLQEAISMDLEQSGRSMTKEVYPALAAQFHVNPALVERAMRSAIQYAWEHALTPSCIRLFPQENGIYPRPSNSTFIATIAQEVRWQIMESTETI